MFTGDSILSFHQQITKYMYMRLIWDFDDQADKTQINNKKTTSRLRQCSSSSLTLEFNSSNTILWWRSIISMMIYDLNSDRFHFWLAWRNHPYHNNYFYLFEINSSQKQSLGLFGASLCSKSPRASVDINIHLPICSHQNARSRGHVRLTPNHFPANNNAFQKQ